MSSLWAGALAISVVFGVLSGRFGQTGTASLEGAGAAVEFILDTGGLICLWSGVLEIMRRSGLMDSLSKLLKPLLRRLFPKASREPETLSALSANVSANLLGLGNAATPMGIRAARGMAKHAKNGVASSELCLLVVINTASIQLLPTTVAAVRAANGSAAPFDILPAVWISSIASVTVGVLAAKLFEGFSRK